MGGSGVTAGVLLLGRKRGRGLILKIGIILFAILLLFYPLWWTQEERRVEKGETVCSTLHRVGTVFISALMSVLFVLFSVVIVMHSDSFVGEGKSDLRSGIFGIIAVSALFYIFTLIFNRYYLKVYRFSRILVWLVLISIYGLTASEFVSVFF